MTSPTTRPSRPARSRRTPEASPRRPAPVRRPQQGRPEQGRPQQGRPARAPRAPRSQAAPLVERQSRAWRRGAILLTILVVLAVMLVPTIRSLVRQRTTIAALETSIAAQQQSVSELQAENGRWQDPAYVEQQARERLKFVRPGDKSYTVIDGSSSTADKVPAGANIAASSADASAPWYGRMWQSVRLADQPTAGLLPVK